MKSLHRNFRATAAIALAVALGAGALVADVAFADTTETSPARIARAPNDLPAPLARREATTVKVELDAVELLGALADGTSYRYWTFNSEVPGPMVRVRVGDTVKVTMRNAADSWMIHNVDFHAVTGPHGGGHATMTDPGGQTGFTFKAMKPGLYVYHCATPMVAQHIANGMYGMILVEPEEGLAPVDREFYVMQGEIYTEEMYGTAGELTESYEKLLDERPEYYVFNGSVHGLKTEAPLRAKVGETIRIFFGVGGPNKTSAFHVIGEIFDQVYPLGTVTGGATHDVQTVNVAPGGALVAELTLEVPGQYVLVDHALSRVERGLAAILEVEGPANPEVFDETTGEQLTMAD